MFEKAHTDIMRNSFYLGMVPYAQQCKILLQFSSNSRNPGKPRVLRFNVSIETDTLSSDIRIDPQNDIKIDPPPKGIKERHLTCRPGTAGRPWRGRRVKCRSWPPPTPGCLFKATLRRPCPSVWDQGTATASSSTAVTPVLWLPPEAIYPRLRAIGCFLLQGADSPCWPVRALP